MKQTLPDYMMPSGFVAVDALPLTPNGKIDVRALPDPFGKQTMRGEYEPPAPGLERLVAEIWRDVLKIEQVGADDNFFELGGNSLLSLRVVGAIEKRTGCRLQPRLFFFQSLRQVAANVHLAKAKLAYER